MDALSGVIDYILNDLGSTVALSIVMLVLGLVVGMRPVKAFSAAVMFGVGFSAMSLVINYMTGAISPAAEAMTQSVGKSFEIVDGGWPTLALITWTWRSAFLLFPLQIAINAVMFVTGRTKTLNVDLWNVWGKAFMALVVEFVTGSFALAMVVASLRMVLELVLGDAIQPRILKRTGLPGVTCPHSGLLHMATLYPVDLLLRKVPFLNRASFDAEYLRSKIGIFADNHIMGFVLGILFGLVARYSVAQSLVLGFSAACAMTMLPIATDLFGKALTPISDACRSFMERRFKGREVLIGLDIPILLGSSEIWAASMVSVPFTLLWAIVMPWNNMLPFAGIVNYGCGLVAYYVCNGNLLRMILLMAGVSAPLYLWCGNAVAPLVSELALDAGIIEGGLISNSCIDCPLFTYAFAFLSQVTQGNFLPLVFAAYFAFGYFRLIRDLRREARDDAAAAEAGIGEVEACAAGTGAGEGAVAAACVAGAGEAAAADATDAAGGEPSADTAAAADAPTSPGGPSA